MIPTSMSLVLNQSNHKRNPQETKKKKNDKINVKDNQGLNM